LIQIFMNFITVIFEYDPQSKEIAKSGSFQIYNVEKRKNANLLFDRRRIVHKEFFS
jgi:hypothetical protein